MVYIIVNGTVVSKDMMASGAGVGWACSASWSGKVNAGWTFSATLNNGQAQSYNIAVKAQRVENETTTVTTTDLVPAKAVLGNTSLSSNN